MRTTQSILFATLLLESTPAWAISWTELPSVATEAETVVPVNIAAEEDGAFECADFSGPDPGIGYRWDADRDGGWDADWVDIGSFDVPVTGVDGPDTVEVPVQAHCYQFNGVTFQWEENVLDGTLVVQVANVPPTVLQPSVVGADPSALVEGVVYSFTASGTDVEAADTLGLPHWDWNDGLQQDGATVSRAFGSGSWSVTVSIADDDGGVGANDLSVAVANVAPTIQTLTLPSTVPEGGAFQAAVRATDPWDALTATWFVGGFSTTGATATLVADGDDGPLDVRVVVSDGEDSVERTGSVMVTNVAPEVEIEGDVDDSDGQPLTWSVRIDDPGPDTHTVVWDFGDGTGGPAGTSASHGYLQNGVYTVTATVTDDDGGVSVDTLDVLISGYGPDITGLVVPTPVDEGSPSTHECTGIDTQGTGGVTVAWDFGDGTAGVGSPVVHAFADEGFYTVECTATDADGGTTDRDRVVTVRNVAPEITTSPSLSGAPGVLYGVSFQADEPGADTLEWTLLAGPPGADIGRTTGRLTWLVPGNASGTYDLSVRVADGDGGEDELSWTVDVSFVDDDNDGMADAWETDNGLDPTDPSDAALDPDGDGRTNADEYAGGTDPFADDRPEAPTLLAPAEGQRVPTARPPLLIEPVTSPTGDPLTYEVAIYDDATGAVLVTGAADLPPPGAGEPVWVSDVDLAENGGFAWSARAVDPYAAGPWAPLVSFRVDAVPEPPPTPVAWSPLDGGTVATRRPLLKAALVSDPDGGAVRYRFRLLTPALDVIEAGDGTVGPDLAVYGTDTLLADGDEACWEVKAVDDTNLSSPWSEAWCFEIDVDNLPPTAPVFDDPLDGDLVAEAQPALRIVNGVDPEGRATWLEVEVSTAADFDDPDTWSALVLAEGIDTVLTVDRALEEDRTHYARALATDGAADSDWAAISFFVSTRDDPPPPPELRAPDDGALATGDVVFEVGPVSDPEGQPVTYAIEVRDAGGAVAASTDGLEAGAGGVVTWDAPPLSAGDYTWTAWAVPSEGPSSEEAEPRALTVDDPEGRTNSRELPDDRLVAASSCGCSSTGSGAWMALSLSLLALRRRRRS